MKKTWMGLGMALLLACPGLGQELSEKQKWIEQIDGGFVFPASQAAARGYAMGVGGDILVGYRFSRQFSLSADLGYYDCDQKFTGAVSGEWLYTPLMAVARLNFGPGWVKPFVSLGAGFAMNTYSLTVGGIKSSNHETDFLLAPGLGVMFIITDRMALYAQGRLDMNFTSLDGIGNPYTDSPTIFIPFKGGLSFFVL
ncbi:MAG TPA: outer membrane beta-barrel protein [bacterium]|nr:outer membrane beta-barrel protein [bacterium]